MNAGALVSDELVIRLVDERFNEPDAADGARCSTASLARSPRPRRSRRCSAMTGSSSASTSTCRSSSSPRGSRRAGSARSAAPSTSDTDVEAISGTCDELRRRRHPARRRPARRHPQAPRDLRARHRAAALLLRVAGAARDRGRRPTPTTDEVLDATSMRSSDARASREALAERTGQDAQGRQGRRRDARGDAGGDPPRRHHHAAQRGRRRGPRQARRALELPELPRLPRGDLHEPERHDRPRHPRRLHAQRGRHHLDRLRRDRRGLPRRRRLHRGRRRDQRPRRQRLSR